jgi:hypothetical protein
MSSRKNEQDKTHFRTERLVGINGQWFFMTRENPQPKGPFATRKKAELGLKAYAEAMASNRSQFEAEAHIRLLTDNFVGDRY